MLELLQESAPFLNPFMVRCIDAWNYLCYGCDTETEDKLDELQKKYPEYEELLKALYTVYIKCRRYQDEHMQRAMFYVQEHNDELNKLIEERRDYYVNTGLCT